MTCQRMCGAKAENRLLTAHYFSKQPVEQLAGKFFELIGLIVGD